MGKSTIVRIKEFLISTKEGRSFKEWLDRHFFSTLGFFIVFWVLFLVPQVSHLYRLPTLFPFELNVFLFWIYLFALQIAYVWISIAFVPAEHPEPLSQPPGAKGLLPRLWSAVTQTGKILGLFLRDLWNGFKYASGKWGWGLIVTGGILTAVTVQGFGKDLPYFLSPPLRYTISCFCIFGGILLIYRGKIFQYEGCYQCQVTDCSTKIPCQEQKQYVWEMLRNIFLILVTLNIFGELLWIFANESPQFSFRIYALWAITHLLFCIFIFARVIDTWNAYSAAPIRLVSVIVIVGFLMMQTTAKVGTTVPLPSTLASKQKITEQWLKQLEQRISQVPEDEPVIFVAASGGGSRAAVFTALVLEGLQQELFEIPVPSMGKNDENTKTETRRIRPGKNVVLVSSVSGGTLGSAVYLAGQVPSSHSSEKGTSESGSSEAKTSEEGNLQKARKILEHSTRNELYRQIREELDSPAPTSYSKSVFGLFKPESQFLTNEELNEKVSKELWFLESAYVDEMCLNFMAPLLRGVLHPGWERGKALEMFWKQRFGLLQTNFPGGEDMDANSTSETSPANKGENRTENQNSVPPLLCCNAAAVDQGNQIIVGFPPIPAEFFARNLNLTPTNTDPENRSPASPLLDNKHDPTGNTPGILEQVAQQKAAKSSEFPRSLQSLEITPGYAYQLSLSEAVRVSANFPFGFAISRINLKTAVGDKNKPQFLHLIDGGVFDNTGVTTLRYLMEGLSRLARSEHPLAEKAQAIMKQLAERGVILLEIDSGAKPQQLNSFDSRFSAVHQPLQALESASYANARLSVGNHLLGIQSSCRDLRISQLIQRLEQLIDKNLEHSRRSSQIVSEARETLNKIRILERDLLSVHQVSIQCNHDKNVMTAWALGSEDKAKIFLRYLSEKPDMHYDLKSNFQRYFVQQDLIKQFDSLITLLDEHSFTSLEDVRDSIQWISADLDRFMKQGAKAELRAAQNYHERVRRSSGNRFLTRTNADLELAHDSDSMQRLAENYNFSAYTMRKTVTEFERIPIAMSRLYSLPEDAAPEDRKAVFNQIRGELENVWENVPEGLKSELKKFERDALKWQGTKSPGEELKKGAMELSLQYRDLWRADSRFISIQQSPTFLAHRVHAYQETLRIAENLETTSDYQKALPHIQRFWEYYWGRLLIVEETPVEEAMVGLGKLVQEWTSSGKKPEKFNERVETLKEQLEDGIKKANQDIQATESVMTSN